MEKELMLFWTCRHVRTGLSIVQKSIVTGVVTSVEDSGSAKGKLFAVPSSAKT